MCLSFQMFPSKLNSKQTAISIYKPYCTVYYQERNVNIKLYIFMFQKLVAHLREDYLEVLKSIFVNLTLLTISTFIYKNQYKLFE